MIACPSCGSSRIRDDYKPAPFYLRVMGVRSLLCDHCNHQFRGFSPAPPKQRIPQQTRRKADVFNPAPSVDLNNLNKQSAQPAPAQVKRIRLNRVAATSNPQPTVAGELLSNDRLDLRTEVTRLYELGLKELPEKNGSKDEHLEGSSASCPECGSRDVKRRRRSGIERAVFAVTDHKAFHCKSCGTSFYAKLDQEGESSILKSSDAAVL